MRTRERNMYIFYLIPATKITCIFTNTIRNQFINSLKSQVLQPVNDKTLIL